MTITITAFTISGMRSTVIRMLLTPQPQRT